MALIFAAGVPESASLTVLQHQICNFRIKRRMSLIETTHVALLRLTMSATIFLFFFLFFFIETTSYTYRTCSSSCDEQWIR